MVQQVFEESLLNTRERIPVAVITLIGGGLLTAWGSIWLGACLVLLVVDIIIAQDFFTVLAKHKRGASKKSRPLKTSQRILSSKSSANFLCLMALATTINFGAMALCGWRAYRAEKDAFRRDIHIHQVTAHWVKMREGVYRHGLVASILNKNALRVHLVDEVGFSGSFEIGGPGGRFGLQTLIMGGDGSGEVTGQYYLSAGTETKLKLLLGNFTEMEIYDGVPGMTYKGTWRFTIGGEDFSTPVVGVRTVSVMSLEEWESL